MALSRVNRLALEARPKLVFCAPGQHALRGTCAGRFGSEASPLLPDLQHDLAAGVLVGDPGQRLARLLQRQHCLDLGAKCPASTRPPISKRYLVLGHARKHGVPAPLGSRRPTRAE